jgi:polysaccharide deacetylase family protein (PEP-CTERM system associated)
MPTTERNAFTVDLEDWYHGLTSTNRRPESWSQCESRVVQNTERLLGLLAEHNVKATFFVLGKVAEQYPDLIRSIAAQGHELGVHGYAHRMVHRLTRDEFAAEIDQTLDVLRPLAHGPIIGHRAPYFSINGRSLWALDVLTEQGFRYDSSFFPTRNMLYGYPEAPRFPHQLDNGSGLVEFPASTVRLAGVTWPISGGFYVRTWPYRVVRRAIQHLNGQGQPAILYMHPWELDTGQPMHAATLRERVTHYHGRRGLESKLRQLFQDFQFGPLQDLLDHVAVKAE